MLTHLLLWGIAYACICMWFLCVSLPIQILSLYTNIITQQNILALYSGESILTL